MSYFCNRHPFARLVMAVSLLLIFLTGCGTSRHSISGGKGKPDTTVDFSHLSRERRKIAEEACSWIGTPYMYAGQEKGVGTDCSGMVMRVYEDIAGCRLPRNSAKQAEFCDRLRYKDVRPGDLVFFATGKDPKRISHVGIMLDDVQFVHASTSKGVVVSKVNAPYYVKTLIMFGRVPASRAGR